MAPPADDDDLDRAAILRRRSLFVTSAIAGLGFAAACSDGVPAPCLDMPPAATDGAVVPPSAAPSETAEPLPSAAPGASAAPAASASTTSTATASASAASPPPPVQPPSPCLRIAGPKTAPPKPKTSP